MAAYGIKSSVYILPNPGSSDHEPHRDLTNVTIAQRNVTFRVDITSDILTLHNGPAHRGDDISGLAYVPTLNPDDPCFRDHVPPNATRLDDLPPLRFDVIGYAPWASGECALRFVESAAADYGKTKALIFYPVANGSNSSVMTSQLDSMRKVKLKHYQFPVYAISSVDGEFLMGRIAAYSRNMTDVWDSPYLTKTYDIADYARVYIEVDTGSRNPLPGLWLFLLIVIGVLIIVIAFTSFVMHWIQYRHRVDLRRRVASGEVDLEAMGIKRLTVPLAILRRFPLKVYQGSTTPPTSPKIPPTVIESTVVDPPISPQTDFIQPKNAKSENPKQNITLKYLKPSPPLAPSSVITKPAAVQRAVSSHAFSQTNCAVCLEEFESGVSTVRELPCLHIFHPECIDPHLSTNSSLCPLCKASALPRGYVPPYLTNATVRRERNMRRMRERYAEMNGTDVHPRPRGISILFALPSFIATRWGGSGTIASGNGVRSNHILEIGHRWGSFSAMPAPTQEEEDEEWRNLSLSGISKVILILDSNIFSPLRLHSLCATFGKFLFRLPPPSTVFARGH
ncbi:hypothetical protein BDZ91DRAFT_353665 [Kalaharituber pfeilii]|nr:hypothetical protein BDZ91DRAFT_353665 [Kalaharituber pfeilii]